MMICCHIGLPKTGTTLLQHTIFPRIEGVKICHRAHSDAARRLFKRIKQYVRSPEEPNKMLGVTSSKLSSLLAQQPLPGRLLISDENISMSAEAFWSGEGPSPREVARRLYDLLQGIDGLRLSPKIIIGIRGQTPWLASRYAQSSAKNVDFCQSHFEYTIRKLVSREHGVKTQLWLNFDLVQRDFAEIFGKDNVLIMPLEFIEVSSYNEISRVIAEFLGIDGIDANFEDVDLSRRPNALSRSENSWKLKSGRGFISVPENLKWRIEEFYSKSNQAFRENYSARVRSLSALQSALAKL